MRFVLLMVVTIPATAGVASEPVKRFGARSGADTLAFVRNRRILVHRQLRPSLRLRACCSSQDAWVDSPTWIDLFNGRTLEGWQRTNFGGEGEVRVENGRIMLDFGDMLTGITYQGVFPTLNYELQLQAMRTDGVDFFCGLTFPVGDTHCSLIAAGWAGAVVGLSCIDGRDASENETTKYMRFEDDRWYAFRVRVTDERITAWIDDRQVIDHPIGDHLFTTRPEMELSKPLGIAAWQTRAALRGLAYRRLE